ncbi:hypothetical protein PoB_002578400 [Plakobranchus ocellatus]|uniref:Uncharacterized protein n=1 Tax=Plakobranchus ocellatus TaxID=259542 RepID=A0AAV3ZZB2_9GAST|nr:hypothetical protein PoB_002578400 [Plakobranchus ocellatus]
MNQDPANDAVHQAHTRRSGQTVFPDWSKLGYLLTISSSQGQAQHGRPSYPFSARRTQASNEKLTCSGLGFEPRTSNLVANCPTR